MTPLTVAKIIVLCIAQKDKSDESGDGTPRECDQKKSFVDESSINEIGAIRDIADDTTDSRKTSVLHVMTKPTIALIGPIMREI